MHIARITFDRVFDIQRRAASRFSPQRTDFSFELGGKQHYSVQVPGWPNISAGDTVTAVLKIEGNWQTLVGWKNHSTGEIVVPKTARSIAGAGEGAFVGILFLVAFNNADSSVGRVAAGCFSAFGFLMSVVLFLQWRRQKMQAEVIQREA